MTTSSGQKGSQKARSHITADIARIVQGMTRWRLLSKRRIIGRLVLRETVPDLDLAHLDVIEAARLIAQDGEITVGAIAQAMHIDPSRGSRLVSQLVDEGLLRRAVSQADARRTVVELADKAKDFYSEKNQVHAGVVRSVTRDWPESDVERFSGLLLRFVEGLEAVAKEENL